MKLTRRNFVRTTGLVAAGVGLNAGLSGAAHAQSNDTIKVAYSARGLRTIDPHKSIQGVDNNAIIHVYDKLVDLPLWRFPTDPNALRPRLATSWSSSTDSKIWTFQLRQGVQFQKGYGEMTSEDVKFSFDRVRDSERVGATRPKFDNIVDVQTDGLYTVTFQLDKPDPFFLLGVLSDYDGGIMSKKAVEDIGEEEIGLNPIGTGPYMLDTLYPDPGQGVLMTAFDDHWDGSPATKNIQFMYISDTTARTLAILSGEVHMIDGVRSPGWADSISARSSDLIFDVVSPGSFFTLHVNTTVAPFDDVRVRQALFYAIDRDEITQAIAPVSKRTFGLLPPSFPGGFNDDTIPDDIAYRYDPDKAKSLLADAGYPDGFSFNNDTSQREDYSAIMLMIQDQLRRVGLDMQLNIKDHTAFHAGQAEGTNTLSQISSALPPVPTRPIQDYLVSEAVVKSDATGGGNFSRYGVAVPGIDDKFNMAMEEPDLAKRLELVREIEVQFLSDAVLLPVATNGWMMVRSPKLDLGFDVESGYVNWPLSKATLID